MYVPNETEGEPANCTQKGPFRQPHFRVWVPDAVGCRQRPQLPPDYATVSVCECFQLLHQDNIFYHGI